MTARAQAYRVYAAPEPRLLDRPVRNVKGGWRIVAAPRPSHPGRLPCPASCHHWRQQRLAAALVLLAGLVGLALFLIRTTS